jgi:hypothetical protein
VTGRAAPGVRTILPLAAEQVDQGAEVLMEPVGTAGTATHQARRSTPGHGEQLAAVAEPLDPVDQDPPTG